MKYALLFVVIFFVSAPCFAKNTRVKEHVTENGTYVPAHVRTTPNRTKNDNYSTRGNYNPYTGKPGKKKRD